MKTSAIQPPSRSILAPLLISALVVTGLTGRTHAANKTWDGGGADDFWQNGVNWNANTAPSPGDLLFFTLTTRLNNTNDFPAGTTFNGITFSAPAGAFVLNGNQVTLGGGITNNQVVVTETISLPLALSATRGVSVANNASLTIGGVISGGFGLTKSGGGLVTLNGANTFAGPLTINAGIVSLASDGNLGTAPGAVTPGNVVINNGTLRATANFTINANRGIALGPTGGSGAGTVDVPSGLTLTYGGVFANNGGTGGLSKLSFGGLTLSGVNTYTGPTTIKNGTITLDFAQAASPVDNILSSSSPLILGGENSGLGVVTFSALTLNGKASAANSQTVNGTTIDIGPQVVRANSGSGGTANIILGALTHVPGGDVTFVPPAVIGGLGNITTTTTNVNGILGGWALIGDGSQLNQMTIGTNWASVDASGNIVNYTNHVVYQSAWGKIRGNVTASDNLLIDDSSSAGSTVIVDVEGAGTVTDVNTINFRRSTPIAPVLGWTLRIGSNNVLRLGKYGSLFKSDTSTHPVVVGFGQNGERTPTGVPSGSTAQDNGGILTAGGAPNTPGEILINFNQSNQGDANHQMVMSKITDNGSGKVTVIKAGSGPLNLGGHNTYSGGTYMIQGRAQAGGAFVGTANPDAYGSGPVYVFPGCYLYLNPAQAGLRFTNELFIAGNGTQAEPLGAIRFQNTGWDIATTVTLIGDATIGGNNGLVSGKITGPFNLTMGSGATVAGSVLYSNTNNDWTGTTTMQSRNTGANRVDNGASEVIPHGFGKGNVVMLGVAGGTITWNLNGFNETINGLALSGNGPSCFIQNNSTTPSTLTVGDNDQSASFGGTIQDGAAPLALTKIGGGLQTLTAANTYSGNTTVSGGTLALSGAGSIAGSSAIFVNSGAALDVSGLSDFAAPTLRMNNGNLVGNSANLSITSVSMTNSQLTIVPDTGDTALLATTLTTGGVTNRINITAVAGVSGYPALFPLIKYTGTIGGAGNNFVIGEVPSTNTVGYISNEVANARLVLVLLDGPKPLTWTGISGRNWDVSTTTNWLAFKGTVNQVPAAFNRADSTFFDDTGLTNDVNLISILVPGGVTVSNTLLNYTFGGSGTISGLGGLLKQGAGTLTIANTGVSDFRGGVAVSGGTAIFATDNAIAGGVAISSGATAQVGTNGPTGTLPGGNVENEGTLTFNRTASLTVPNNIGGNGSIVKNNTNIVTLSGVNSSFTGAVSVVQGTLRAGSISALGTADGTTTVNSGATLDINAQQLNTEPVIVSGTGVGGAGAIINSSAEQINALGNVILTNNTSFGGSGRWDIRGGAASLTTGGQPYSLLKTGANQVSLVGLTTIDSALADIDIQQGIFAVQTTTVQVGDATKTITVRTNAALSLFGLTDNPLNKLISVQSGGTITNESGASIITGTATLNGNSVIGVAGTSLTMNGVVGGSGTLRKTGASILILNGNNTYSGSVTNLGGTLALNGLNNSAGPLTNIPGTTLAGRGSYAGAVSLGTNVTLLPGDANVAGTLTSGPLTLNSARINFDLATNDFNNAYPVADLISVNGNLTLSGVTTNTLIAGPIGSVTNGQIITLIQYTGGRTGGTNNMRLVSSGGYGFSFIDPATTTNFIRVIANKVPLNTVWRGGAPANPTAWDIETTTNWVNAVDNTTPVDYSDFDSVSFGDTANTNRLTLVTNLQPASITMNNNVQTYTFAGSGWLSGASGLTLQGAGTLIIANSGTNTFTGPININAGTLQIGDGSTNGNLGTGPLTNNAGLVFNRSGNLTVANNIAGGGSLTNNGDGIVTVAGANSYAGTVMIAKGTLRAGSGTALGMSLGTSTIIANGATLDTGGQTLNTEPIFVSGAGVGGLGAIVNNVNDAANGLGDVTLEGHTTFGGTRRWDIRGGAAALNTSGNAYNLTKVGSNEVWIVNSTVDAALNNVTVQAGLLGYQDNTSGFGNPAATLTIGAGGGLGFFNTTVPLDKVMVLNGSGTNNTIDSRSGTANTITRPLALNGGCIFNVGAGSLTLNGSLAGSASITKSGAGLLDLTGASAYTGNTTVSGGTLALFGPASLPATPTLITISAGATLDVTALTAGPTLTLSAGQTLQGAGSINGSLVSPVGTIVAPGSSVGVLTVTNDATLQGTTIMELTPLSNTNDRLRTIIGSITYGGTLIVTNSDGVYYGNEVFKLFDSGTGSYLSSFASIQLPPLPPGYFWNTSQLNVDGTLRLKGPPTITSIRVSGGNVIVSGTNGTNNGAYYVLTSTNVTLPLTSWTRLTTNVFDSNGNFSFTDVINTAQRFYLVQVP